MSLMHSSVLGTSQNLQLLKSPFLCFYNGWPHIAYFITDCITFEAVHVFQLIFFLPIQEPGKMWKWEKWAYLSPLCNRQNHRKSVLWYPWYPPTHTSNQATSLDSVNPYASVQPAVTLGDKNPFRVEMRVGSCIFCLRFSAYCKSPFPSHVCDLSQLCVTFFLLRWDYWKKKSGKLVPTPSASSSLIPVNCISV